MVMHLATGNLQDFFMKVCDAVANQECKVAACREGRLMQPGKTAPDCVVRVFNKSQ